MANSRQRCTPIWLSTALLMCLPNAVVHGAQTDITGPAGSVLFGASVAALPNGNIVVADPRWATGSAQEVGAVYLYTSKGQMLSRLTGSSDYDHVGTQIVMLANGNFVVGSPDWSSSTVANVGAVTWVDANTGLSGTVSPGNSLVGSSRLDEIGSDNGVIALPNGNYLVLSMSWSNGSATLAGAITWANGSTGAKGAVSASNSLVGSHAGDQVGFGNSPGPRAVILSNGNAVVTSLFWANGSAAGAGAATWINAQTGLHGALSSANSLVGSSSGDEVGYGNAVALTNGNYVVSSPLWNNGSAASAGAATWGNGSSGTTGVVSASNSLVGTTSGDSISIGANLVRGVAALSNGNYVVFSPDWNNGAATSAGAATWANGATGLSGPVSTTNSLYGTASDDHVGYGGVAALSNGNYVVSSYRWNNGSATEVGAVTWANGTNGLSGPVTPANSLTGSTTGDEVGFSVTALTNGNYVIGSPFWSNGATSSVGAATWVNGASAHSGTVSTSNSLTGTVAGDSVGSPGIAALTNGNYVVASEKWNNGAHTQVGAVTWGNGASGLSGAVSSANSLTGSTDGDQVGNAGVFPLANGNYFVSSTMWNGTAQQAGAATWGDGSKSLVGVVSATNSLVGSTAGDSIGFDSILTFSNSNYLIVSFDWDNGAITDAGAVTVGRANGGTVGPLTTATSVLGTVQGGGTLLAYDYDTVRDLLVVGLPPSNVVTLFVPDSIFKNGFE